MHDDNKQAQFIFYYIWQNYLENAQKLGYYKANFFKKLFVDIKKYFNIVHSINWLIPLKATKFELTFLSQFNNHLQ